MHSRMCPAPFIKVQPSASYPPCFHHSLSYPRPAERPAHVAKPTNHANEATPGCSSTHPVIPRKELRQEVEFDEDDLD